MLSKILEDCSKFSSKKDKVQFLKSHHPNNALKIMLGYCFDPNVQFVLPEGSPPFKEEKYPPDNGGLYDHIRKMYLFVKGGNDSLHQARRERLFLDILEVIDPKEAELLISIKDKKLPYKGITKNIVKSAFPELQL